MLKSIIHGRRETLKCSIINGLEDLRANTVCVYDKIEIFFYYYYTRSLYGQNRRRSVGFGRRIKRFASDE